MKKFLVAVLGLCLLGIDGPLYGHGVSGEAAPGGIAVTFTYSSQEAMAFAKITVTSPTDGKTFQVGNADRHGRFCFFPDAPGDWQVTADDNQGHRLTVTVPVTQDQLQGFQVKPATPAAVSRLERTLVGLSLIFGVAGLLIYWRARKMKT